MSTIFLFFIVSLIILIIIALILYSDDAYVPYSEKTPIPDTYYNEYNLPAPWFYVIRNTDELASSVIFNGTENVNVTFPDGVYNFTISNSKFIAGTDPTGVSLAGGQLLSYKLVGSAPLTATCTPYTFISSQTLTPTQAKFTSLNNCVALPPGQNGVPGSCYPSIDREKCIDDDQIYANQNIHVCYGQINYGMPTGDLCRDQFGQFQSINSIEKFYSSCGPNVQSSGTQQTPMGGSSVRCPGSLSLLILGTQGDTTNPMLCINDPKYTLSNTGSYTNLSPMNVTTCSLNSTYLDFPNQLFRVKSGVYQANDITFSPSGPFLRIYSRATGLCLAPSLVTINGIINPTLPIVGGELQLLNCGSTKFGGYWWYILPQITQPPPYQLDSKRNEIINIIRSQLIYVTDPSIIPGNTSNLTNWVWGNINNLYSIQNKNGIAILDKIIYVNQNEAVADQTLSKKNTFTYIDYTLVPLLNI